MYEAVKRWRRSKSDSPRLLRMLKASCSTTPPSLEIESSDFAKV